MPLIYTDRDGAEIDPETWRLLRAQADYRTVDSSFVTVPDAGRLLVATQWHGLTVVTNSGDLLWKFVTVVCSTSRDFDEWTRTYDTLADAQAGHLAASSSLKEGRWPT